MGRRRRLGALSSTSTLRPSMMRDTRAAICAADDCRIINRFRQFKHEIEVAAARRVIQS